MDYPLGVLVTIPWGDSGTMPALLTGLIALSRMALALLRRGWKVHLASLCCQSWFGRVAMTTFRTQLLRLGGLLWSERCKNIIKLFDIYYVSKNINSYMHIKK